jgi:ABC-type oligopeptide transport system substrate-binding subunit
MMNHRSLSATGVAALALLALAAQANAASVMEFPQDATLKGKVVLADYNFRSAPPIARQCAGQSGRGSFTVTKLVDGLSAQLTEASKAKKGSLLMIDDTKADGTHVAYQLTDATISGIKPATGGVAPMESVSFNYSKIQWITISPCKVAAQPRRNNNAGVSSPSSSYGGGYGNGGGY